MPPASPASVTTAPSVPALRIESREIGNPLAPFTILATAWNEAQGAIKLAALAKGHPDFEFRSVANVLADQSEHAERDAELSRLRDLRGALLKACGTDDTDYLGGLMKKIPLLEQELAAARQQTQELLAAAEAGRTPEAATVELPFSVGDEVQDEHSLAIVRVTGIDTAGFSWELPGIDGAPPVTGHCPFVSAVYFRPVKKKKKAAAPAAE